MFENPLKQQWAAGRYTVNGWLHIPNTWSAEVLANQPYDSLTVDLQHSMTDFETAVTMFQAIGTTDVLPLTRVPWLDPGLIGRLLDAGAIGVICPLVNTREECERFVGACRYPPLGYRSLGPTRARVIYGADYGKRANDEVLAIAMIETTRAVANIDAILSVPGLDAIYVGPGDLSLSLGSDQRIDNTDPVFLDTLNTIVAACKRHGIVAGIHTNDPAYTRLMIEKGFQFVTIMTDSVMLARTASNAIAAVREAPQPQG